MPNTQIFPSTITEFSTEGLIQKHSTKSKAIYWILILLVIAFGISIFFVEIDVNINSQGIITSEKKATQIKSPVFGKVLFVDIFENKFVHKNDTIIIIDTSKIVESIKIVKEKIKTIESQISDLQIITKLTKNSRLRKNKLKTKLYKQELQKFASDLSYQKAQINIIKKEYKRQTILFNKQVIPVSEYEQISYKYKDAKLKYNQIFDSQLASWQKQLDNKITETENLKKQLIELNPTCKKHP